MPSYLVMGDWTEQGIRNVKDGPGRLDAVKQLCQENGGRLIFFYMLMGEHDFAALMELPDDERATHVLLQVGMVGNARTQTMKAFSEEEYQQIIASLP